MFLRQKEFVVDRRLQRAQIAALKFLGSLPEHIRYDILHPQRLTVIRTLGEVIDDPRRAVRLQAVEARYVHQKHETHKLTVSIGLHGKRELLSRAFH